MLKVTFMLHSKGVTASDRLRALIPGRILREMGVDVEFRKPGDPGLDRTGRVLVASKHRWSWDQETSGYRATVFDVCDDHLEDGHGAHYHYAAEEANVVTCSTSVLARDYMGVAREAVAVIDDPYEISERDVMIGNTLLWFGNALGLPALKDALPRLKGYKLEICTNLVEGLTPKGVTEYSPEALDQALARAGLVVLPVGPGGQAKSANRAVHAIRAGRMPVCQRMPAYDELSAFVPVLTDLGAGVAECLADKRATGRKLANAQQYVEWRFDPRRIALQWYNLLRRM